MNGLTHMHPRMRPGNGLAAAIMLLVLVVALIAMVSALAASSAARASAVGKGDRALTSARSGAELILYILQEMRDKGSAGTEMTLPQLKAELKAGLAGLEMNGVTVTLQDDIISVSSVVLKDSTGQSFTAAITCEDGKNVTANVTGLSGDACRLLCLKCNLVTGTHLIYDPAADAGGPVLSHLD
jgi:hypothetical protein